MRAVHASRQKSGSCVPVEIGRGRLSEYGPAFLRKAASFVKLAWNRGAAMMRHMSRWSLMAALVAILGPAIPTAQDSSTKAAQTAVDAWLSLTDSRSYGESWDAAANLFKKAITKEKWSDTLQAVRAPLGQVKSRTFKSATPTATPPGAPSGEYVVFVFNTDFDQRAAATETVSASKEQDGVWRVAGYFIK
jgi:hypothetical protein